MADFDRRQVLAGGAAAAMLHPAIARALAIDADRRTGTIADVEHVVIYMQENRSFDHYFGTLNGVSGFGDRFPIPTPGGKTVFVQQNVPSKTNGPPQIAPFHLNTVQDFRVMRVEDAPHGWADAQGAWNEGRMTHWPVSKTEHAMGHYRQEDIPFQWALADAFTVCDAYHCSIQSSTNTNRLFMWTGANDPGGTMGGPAITNSHDRFVDQGGHPDSYRWTTYPERLLKAGITWRIYQDEADNFTDNSTEGFQTYRDSRNKVPGSDPRLYDLAFKTRRIDGLKEDVLAGKLPQVTWIVAPTKDSEHPGPSSPAQGADYSARVIEALTADPKVWAKTVLLLMYDENDGFFDHVPPPAAPSRAQDGTVHGGSTVDTTGEYHLVTTPSEAKAERPELMGRPYGLGMRVPAFVISPWSRGGWVNSQVFDHTSIIRFLEARFGVMEPNISPWRRAVCGDLTSALDFKSPNHAPLPKTLPVTAEVAARAAALPGRTSPVTPALPEAPVQAMGPRLSRALPYALAVDEGRKASAVSLSFRNTGAQAAVFHVYDRLHLDRAPRRYTVGPGKALDGVWDAGSYDLWVLGPGGFHRHFAGDGAEAQPVVKAVGDPAAKALTITVSNPGREPLAIAVAAEAYEGAPWNGLLAPGAAKTLRWPVGKSRGWYDLSVTSGQAGYLRRIAGRLETGAPSITDPVMGGPAKFAQPVVA